MSISPTNNSQQVNIKPDKTVLPAVPAAIASPDGSVQAAAPVQPTDSIQQNIENQTTFIPLQPPSENDETADTNVKDAVEKLNNVMSSMKRNLEFEYDKDISRTIVTVRDTTTQEVVRVVPTEVAVKLAKNLQETLEASDKESVGQLLDIKT